MDTANSDYINYYYINRNGKFDLRLGSENNAENVTEMFISHFSTYRVFIIIILVAVCVLLVLS